ncbi:MAG: DUF655 domain-containing protein [Methanobacteriota archaeon]|nr:MAG: DUF655 domain-containing protein [Euryarchaeota archaeon]
MEDYIYVLDSIPYGSKYRGQPYIEGIGEKFFTLLEVTLKEGENAAIGERIYVGKDIENRKKADKIKKKLKYDELSSSAKENLFEVVKKIIMANEERFIKFINSAAPVSMRTHQLELIPGVGKKNLETIIKEKEKEPFKDFEDLHMRVSTWQDPVGSLAYRVIEELSGEQRHYFFVLPPRRV